MTWLYFVLGFVAAVIGIALPVTYGLTKEREQADFNDLVAGLNLQLPWVTRPAAVKALARLRDEVEVGGYLDKREACILYDVCRALDLSEVETMTVMGSAYYHIDPALLD